jgi:hypothetical protein
MIPISTGTIDEVLQAGQCDARRGGTTPWPFPTELPKDDGSDWPFEDVDGTLADAPFESDIFVSDSPFPIPFFQTRLVGARLIIDRMCQR